MSRWIDLGTYREDYSEHPFLTYMAAGHGLAIREFQILYRA
jgi:hypothetical protein